LVIAVTLANKPETLNSTFPLMFTVEYDGI
jgi:hypothetical protein